MMILSISFHIHLITLLLVSICLITLSHHSVSFFCRSSMNYLAQNFGLNANSSPLLISVFFHKTVEQTHHLFSGGGVPHSCRSSISCPPVKAFFPPRLLRLPYLLSSWRERRLSTLALVVQKPKRPPFSISRSPIPTSCWPVELRRSFDFKLNAFAFLRFTFCRKEEGAPYAERTSINNVDIDRRRKRGAWNRRKTIRVLTSWTRSLLITGDVDHALI